MALKFSNHNSVSNFWSIPMSWETCYPAMIIQLSESSSSSCIANLPWRIRSQHSIEWKKQNNIRINIYCISVFKGTNIHPYLKTTWMWLVSNACSIRISLTFEITFLAWFSTSLTNFQLGIDKFISPWIVTSLKKIDDP